MNDEYDMGYRDGVGDTNDRIEQKIDSIFKQAAQPRTASQTPTKTEKSKLLTLNIILILMSIPDAIYQGFVLMKLWSWFVLPNFVTAPQIGILSWMGIAVFISTILTGLTISLAAMTPPNDTVPISHKIEMAILKITMYPIMLTLALLFGFIYSLFL